LVEDRRGELRRRGQQAATWLLIAPVHVLLLGVIVIPACYVVWLSLTASTFGRTPVFVGTANYLQVLGDSYFWRALGNTIIVVLIVVHVELLAGLGMALLFASGLPAAAFCCWQCWRPMPSARSRPVMWRYLFDPDIGPLTTTLQALASPS
jgi:multiple sugar transport system permease protein